LAASDAGIPVANTLSEIWLAPAVSSPDAVSIDGQDGPNTSIAVPSAPSENVIYQIADGVPDGAAPEHTGGMATGIISPTPATPVHAFADMTNPHLAIPMAGSSKPSLPLRRFESPCATTPFWKNGSSE
jgi:hypothetical protein